MICWWVTLHSSGNWSPVFAIFILWLKYVAHCEPACFSTWLHVWNMDWSICLSQNHKWMQQHPIPLHPPGSLLRDIHLPDSTGTADRDQFNAQYTAQALPRRMHDNPSTFSKLRKGLSTSVSSFIYNRILLSHRELIHQTNLIPSYQFRRLWSFYESSCLKMFRSFVIFWSQSLKTVNRKILV